MKKVIAFILQVGKIKSRKKMIAKRQCILLMRGTWKAQILSANCGPNKSCVEN